MTSDEIKAAEGGCGGGWREALWLREIAYQLALMNERTAKLDAMILDSASVLNEDRDAQILEELTAKFKICGRGI